MKLIGKIPLEKCLFLLLIVFPLIFISACNKTKTTDKEPLACHLKLSPKELKEDLTILTKSLEALHPALYRVNSKDKIDHHLASINEAIIDSLSYLQFLKLIAPLLTEIGCINTQWGHSREYIKYRNSNIPVFPIEFEISNKSFIVSENYSSNKEINVGDEILEINGVTSPTYLKNNYPLLPIDGKIRSLQHKWLASYFPNHHSNFWEQADTFNLRIKALDGNTRTEKVAARLKKDIHKKKNIEKLLSFKVVDSIAILKVRTFNNRILVYDSMGYTTYLDSVFNQIRNSELSKLILDIRGSSWGELKYAAILFSYLATDSFQFVDFEKEINAPQLNFDSLLQPMQKLEDISVEFLTRIQKPQGRAFTDSLFVLSDGWNVNAGGYFCSKIKYRPKTVFIGEKPGSSTFGLNGIPTFLQLPNSDLSFIIPTVTFIADSIDYNDLNGINISHKYSAFVKEKIELLLNQ